MYDFFKRIKSDYLHREKVVLGLNRMGKALISHTPAYGRYFGMIPSSPFAHQCHLTAEVLKIKFSKIYIKHYDSIKNIEDDYDLIYGEGRLFNIACNKAKNSPFKVARASGYVPRSQNENTEKKAEIFNEKYGILPPSHMLRKVNVEQHEMPLSLADKISVIGSPELALRFANAYGKNASNIWPVFQDAGINPIKYIQSCKSPNSVIYFGSVGHIHKGLDIFIEVAKVNPSLKFVAYGSILSGDIEFFRKNVGIPNNLIFRGHRRLSDPIISRDLSTAICTVFPSVSEGCSTSLVNLIANFGIPVISSVEAGLPLRFIENTIDPFSFDALKISGYIQRMTENSLTYIRERRFQKIHDARNFFSTSNFILNTITIMGSK